MKPNLIFQILILTIFTTCTSREAATKRLSATGPEEFIPPVSDNRLRLFDPEWKFRKGELNGAEAVNFDDSKWRELDLPHDWSIEDLENQKAGEVVGPFDRNSIGTFYTGYTIGGTGWYRKTFTLTAGDQDKDVSIYFDGVYMESDVWINGHFLGSHKHGYTPFHFNLTGYLNKPGEKNTIAVLVRNIGENSRWYSGSGIYRHVWLKVTDPVNIPVWGVFVTTPDISGDKAVVSAAVSIENKRQAKQALTVRTTIIDRDGKKVATSDMNAELNPGERKDITALMNVAGPQLWSDEAPYLYRLSTELIKDQKVIDANETAFGIRSISFTPEKGFLLNGKRVILRGACIHHDNGPLGSVAIDRADQRKIAILKANGFNAIRTSHNPPSQGFLDACDRAGMLVMDEAFDMWLSPKRPDDYHRFFNDWHRSDLQSMILRDRNHPSIILWSIGNEIKERADSSGLRITRELVSIIKDLDTTRPVTEAICEFWETKGRPWADSAPAFALLDVCSYNYVWGEYEKDHKNFPERVIAGTESFAMDIYENWKMATEKPYVTGDFVWTGMDYIGEAGIGQAMPDSVSMAYPWFNANCGDIDLIGFKKAQAYYRDVVWDRSMLEMAVEELPPPGKEWVFRAWGYRREYPTWNWSGNEGKTMKVYVYSKCDEVRLELNGRQIESQKAKSGSKFTFLFRVPYQPGELKAIALTEGKIIAEKTLVTTGPVRKIKITPDRSAITSDRNDLAYLTVELTDADGNRVSDVTGTVRFKVEGNGRLVGVDNGNSRDPKSFQADSCTTWHGRCLAIIRPSGKPGKVTITANCDKIEPASCVITTD